MAPPHEPQRLCSALYRGSTTHTRRLPSANRFTYRVYMAYVDLDEAQSGRLEYWPIFSTRTPFALLSLLPADHMINEPHRRDLATRVRDVVERETGARPRGPIRLLTNLRVAGIEFNPVSFYYVFDTDGHRLQAVVAEVSNFPWFEQHSYVITPAERGSDADSGRDNSDGALARFSGHDKAFHVSPFMGMDGVQYDWLVSRPGNVVRVRIGLQERERGFFMASLDAERVLWTTWNLLRMQVVYPAHTMRVMTGILYEAAKLFRRGFAFFPHPGGTRTRLSSAVEAVVNAGHAVGDVLRRLVPRKANVAT